MQTCYNCGKQVSDETLICPDCGALVRRYTTPANPAVQQAPGQPVQPVQAVQTPPRPPVQGRFRLQGGVKVWLILLSIFSAYMAFSSLCSALFGAYPQVLDAMLADPDMAPLEPMLTTLREFLPRMVPLFVALFILFNGKLACHLWLLLSTRRLPFFVSIGVSILGVILAFVLGGAVSVILYFLDPLLTWLGLRRFWPHMRK